MVHERVYYVAGLPCSTSLRHHGIQGMHWGIRRYQYEDGSLTPEGMIRYNKSSKLQRDLNRLDAEIARAGGEIARTQRKIDSSQKKHDANEEKFPNPNSRQRAHQEKLLNDIAAEKLKLNLLEQQNDIMNKCSTGLKWAALGRGMMVYTKDCPRSTKTLGRELAEDMLLGFVGGAFIAPVVASARLVNGDYVTGTSYKVREAYKKRPIGYKGTVVPVTQHVVRL